MKFLIHLPPQKPFAPAKIRKPPFEFIRSAQHGNLHILDGRELSAEEVNQLADSIFRSKFQWDYAVKPSIRVLIPDNSATDETVQDAGGGEGGETLTVDQENWILAKAEAILQRRTAPPVTPTEAPVIETPEREETAHEAAPETTPEAEEKPKNKGGRPKKAV
jgi:hypothetical protein